MSLIRSILKHAFHLKPNREFWAWVRRGPTPTLSSRTVVIFYDDERHRPRFTQSLKDDLLDILDEHENNANTDITYVKFIAAFTKTIKRTPCVSVRQAADMLEVSVQAVYDMLKAHNLEGFKWKGKMWVTKRSIARFLMYHYHETRDFNVPRQIAKELRLRLK